MFSYFDIKNVFSEDSNGISFFKRSMIFASPLFQVQSHSDKRLHSCLLASYLLCNRYLVLLMSSLAVYMSLPLGTSETSCPICDLLYIEFRDCSGIKDIISEKGISLEKVENDIEVINILSHLFETLRIYIISVTPNILSYNFSIAS